MHRIYSFRRANGHTFATLDTWTGADRPVITWMPAWSFVTMQPVERSAASDFIREQRGNGTAITVTVRQD